MLISFAGLLRTGLFRLRLFRIGLFRTGFERGDADDLSGDGGQVVENAVEVRGVGDHARQSGPLRLGVVHDKIVEQWSQ